MPLTADCTPRREGGVHTIGARWSRVIFRRCSGRGCGQVFGLLAPRMVVRWPWCCPLIRCPDHVGALSCADKATGFRINPLSCASPLGHPRLLGCLGFL